MNHFMTLRVISCMGAVDHSTAQLCLDLTTLPICDHFKYRMIIEKIIPGARVSVVFRGSNKSSLNRIIVDVLKLVDHHLSVPDNYVVESFHPELAFLVFETDRRGLKNAIHFIALVLLQAIENVPCNILLEISHDFMNKSQPRIDFNDPVKMGWHDDIAIYHKSILTLIMLDIVNENITILIIVKNLGEANDGCCDKERRFF